MIVAGDDRGATSPPSELARRVGPPLAVGSLLVTVALLAWLALAPTAVAGPLAAAPFEVPATLVTDAGEDGCFRVVAGDGALVGQHCFEAGDDGWVQSYFNERGDLLVRTGSDGVVMEVDPVTGEVLRDVPRDEWERAGDAGPGAPPDDAGPPAGFVTTDGDQVVQHGDGEPRVLLDLDAPPGYELRNAAVSPDGDWVVAVTPHGEVVVAPTDGSAPPHVWVRSQDEATWLDLHGAIRWDAQVP